MANNNDFIQFSVEGANEFGQVLNAIGDEFQQVKVIQQTLKKTLEDTMVPVMKTGMPWSEKTKKRVKAATERRDQFAAQAGPTQKAFYVRFADRGTKVRTTKAGYNRGAIIGANRMPGIVDPAVPGMLQYFSENWKTIVSDIVEQNNKKMFGR